MTVQRNSLDQLILHTYEDGTVLHSEVYNTALQIHVPRAGPMGRPVHC